MTDKELRRLGRPELIEIIYQLEKSQEESRQEIARLQVRLQDRTLRLSEAGSIAQAALQVNGVMEAAQAAADQYVQAAEADRQQARTELSDAQARAERLVADAQAQAERLVADAQTQADAILSDAQAQARTVTDQAEQHARNHWDLFREKAEQLIRDHHELSALLNGEDPQ